MFRISAINMAVKTRWPSRVAVAGSNRPKPNHHRHAVTKPGRIPP